MKQTFLIVAVLFLSQNLLNAQIYTNKNFFYVFDLDLERINNLKDTTGLKTLKIVSFEINQNDTIFIDTVAVYCYNLKGQLIELKKKDLNKKIEYKKNTIHSIQDNNNTSIFRYKKGVLAERISYWWFDTTKTIFSYDWTIKDKELEVVEAYCYNRMSDTSYRYHYFSFYNNGILKQRKTLHTAESGSNEKLIYKYDNTGSLILKNEYYYKVYNFNSDEITNRIIISEEIFEKKKNEDRLIPEFKSLMQLFDY